MKAEEKKKTAVEETRSEAEIARSKEKKAQLEYQKKMQRPIKGVFHNYENPGAELCFNYRISGKKIKRVKLKDGEITELPLEAIMILNNDTRYPVHANQKNEMGEVHQYVGKKVGRTGFTPFEYADIPEMNSQPEIIVRNMPM